MGLFGPSLKTVWTEFAKEIGGTYYTGVVLRKGYISYYYKNWEIILDIHTVNNGETSTTYTRMRALFNNPYGFRFRIYRRHIFARIGKLFGMQDIETGDPDFDRDFIIKGNQPGKIGALFSDFRVKKILHQLGRPQFYIEKRRGFGKNRIPEGLSQLYFLQLGRIKDKAKLRLYFQLFTTVLDDMANMGVTDKRSIELELKV